MSRSDAGHPLDNAGWHALTTHQVDLAEVNGLARRYRSDVSVFAAVDALTDAAWIDLAALAGPGNVVVLFRVGVPDPPAGWTDGFRGHGHQMVEADAGRFPEIPEVSAFDPVPLEEAHVPAMLELVGLTQPGPFRPRTIEMGRYAGVFENDRLVAMAGERIHLEGFTEISAVCTHPDARGRGLAAALTQHIARGIRERGEQPFLHVAQGNVGARRVYERIGFTTRAMVDFVGAAAPR